MRWQRIRPVTAHPGMPGVLIIALTKDQTALVDEADLELVNFSAWQTDKDGYAAGHPEGKYEHLHRYLWRKWGLPLPATIDHVNGDRRDCRRQNLRPATIAENSRNRKADRSDKLKGACWNKKSNKWQAAIKVSGKSRHLGLFLTQEEAHAAYVQAAQSFFGDFARVA